MKRSPKLKPTKWDALVVLAVLLLTLGLAARPYFAARSAGELTVSIAIDGETVERCALSNYEGGTYESRGYTLTVAVENGAVRVAAKATARIRTACTPARSRARDRASCACPPAWPSRWRARRPTTI